MPIKSITQHERRQSEQNRLLRKLVASVNAGGSGVDTANSPNAGEVARFTDADTIEGLTEAEFKAAFNLEAGTDFLSPAAIAAAYQPLDADLTTWAGLTPSANFQTLVTETFAQIRASLDLEAGTDFYSISAADAAIAAAVANYTLTTDLASTANAKGASLIGIEDSGGLITATTVEGALAENRTAIDAIEADYLVAADIANMLESSDIGVSVQAYDADLTTWAGLTPSANAQSLVTAANYAAMRALLDLEAGTDFLSPVAIAAAYQPLDAGLTSIAGLTTAADRMIYTTALDTYAVATLTSFARSILDDANEATFKATVNLEIGVDVQAYDADLTTWAGLTPSANAQSLVTAANYAAMRALLDLEAGTDFVALSGGTFSGDISVPDEAYGAGWNGSVEVPTKNAIYDKIEALSVGSGGVDIQIFTTSGSWSKPGSGTYAFIRIWGAGGGGGRAGSTDGGGGGGGGAYTERWVLLSALSSSETVTIGAGGGGANSDETEGTVGGDSSFGSVVTAYGGGGGRGSTSNAGGGGGGGGQAGAGVTPGAAPDGGNGGLADGGGYSRGSGGSAAIGGDGKFGIGGGGGGGGNISGAGFRGGDGLEGGGGGGGGGTSDGGQGGSSHRGGAGGGGGGGTTATLSIGGYCHLFAIRGGDGKTGSTVGGDGALFCGGGGTESGNAGDGGDGLCIVMVF